MIRKQDTTATQTAEINVASLADLRGMVADRLQDAQRRLGPSFAKANDSQHDAMIGSLLLGMLCWGPMMDMLAANLGGSVGPMLTSPTLGAVADGFSMIWDEKAHKNRARGKLTVAFKDGVYHGGRKQLSVMDKTDVKKNFNLIAANENSQYAYDAQAEVAGMAEMLEAIDQLERDGVEGIALDRCQSISATLRAAVGGASAKPAVFGRSSLMRMSA